ncbi:hypothetical protein FRZ67_11185 [Panacibacter ginsenosidivorans]|uniref:Uncharacterized protein n=1 Tax=Panacibacter ginsenosidivorans TaxID=1813871 RepID=A0A5B8V906_9BACT|nr:hypothetical protein [Panacibacter ginsenosidivorans]QEC67832.1 hypothetical protein FRZ67_11185 [Panacibacter ginsenosidivorans]
MKVRETANTVRKRQKASRRELIAKKIDHALGMYNVRPGKNYEKGLKKASKLLSKIIIVPVTADINHKKVKPKTAAIK